MLYFALIMQVAKNRFDGDLGRTVLEFDKNSSTFSGHFTKYCNAQYHKEEEIEPPTLKDNPIITSGNINDNGVSTQQPQIVTITNNKSSIFKKSKPFWKVRSNLSKAKK